MLIVPKTKETRLNLRIKPELKADLERVAEWHGLTLSSYAHSILVKAVRRDKESLPELFEQEMRGHELSPHGSPIPHYEPGSKKRNAA